MVTEHNERVDSVSPNADPYDPQIDRWYTRMSWSMLVAGAAHGALFGLWPMSQTTVAVVQPPVPMTDPVWITPYEEGGSTELGDDAITVSGPILPPAVEGAGMITAPGVPEPILVAGPGASERGEGAGADLADLLRRTAGGPSIAGGSSDLAGLEFQSLTEEGDSSLNDLAGDGRNPNPGAGDPTATDGRALDELSALDLALERLAGFSPEVALEATSSWVLIRNPREVEAFMGRHSIERVSSLGTEGAVAVALWIDTRGSVEWAEVIQSSGRADLDQLALELFNDIVRFRPARLAGVLMPMSAIFSVNFALF